MNVRVIQPGLLTTLQDAGRVGFAHLGIGRAGAFDAPALRLANALCGNPPNACALEITLLGPTLRFLATTWIAVTGAPIPVLVDGKPQPMWAPVHVPPNTTVVLGAAHAGCRSYLGVHGGFDTPPVLGSRSTDLNARIGPFDGRPLHAGDVIPIATASCRLPKWTGGHWQLDPRPWFRADASQPLRLLPGTHFEKLTAHARAALYASAFTLHQDSNRVGLRLTGPRLELATALEMLSEGCLPGLVQLPPSGQPIVFGPEGPVSGGYPRIGQVAAVDLPRLAQLRPGDALRFVPGTLDHALHLLARREHALTRLEANISTRLGA